MLGCLLIRLFEPDLTRAGNRASPLPVASATTRGAVGTLYPLTSDEWYLSVLLLFSLASDPLASTPRPPPPSILELYFP